MSKKEDLLTSIKAKKKEIAKANNGTLGRSAGSAPVPQAAKIQMQSMQKELKELRAQLKTFKNT